MSEKVFLNSDLIDLHHAHVSVSNPGLLHGVGLFETLRAYEGKSFRLQDHVNRLTASARKLDMPVDDVIDRIPDAVKAVIDANRLKDARIRITVTPPGQQTENDEATLLVAAQETAGYPPELYERGMTVFVCSDCRQSPQDPLAGHKTTCYFGRLLALRNAQNHNCGEALWFNPDNLLAEGCISNVFIAKGGQLKTPPLHTPVLPGITRALVLELAEKLDLAAEEAPCTIDDLLDADEVLLTNACMEIMPVTRVEGRSIANEKPGPITRQLADAYTDLTRAE
jgi:branched-chain amino acid aminotransferase